MNPLADRHTALMSEGLQQQSAEGQEVFSACVEIKSYPGNRGSLPQKTLFRGQKTLITLFCGTPCTFGGERENGIIYIPALHSFLPYLVFTIKIT